MEFIKVKVGTSLEDKDKFIETLHKLAKTKGNMKIIPDIELEKRWLLYVSYNCTMILIESDTMNTSHFLSIDNHGTPIWSISADFLKKMKTPEDYIKEQMPKVEDEMPQITGEQVMAKLETCTPDQLTAEERDVLNEYLNNK